MARKSPSKARQKSVQSPPPSQLSPSNSPEVTTSTPGPSSIEGKDRDLAALLAEAEGQGQPNAAPLPPPPDPAAELEIYKRLVRPTAAIVSFVVDKANRRFLQAEFVPISAAQVDLIEEDAAYVMKESLDKWMPQFAKDHPRATALCLSLCAIYAANTRRIEKKEPVKASEAVADPVKPAPGSIEIPQEHIVEVTQ